MESTTPLRQRTFRVELRRAGPQEISVRAEKDGHPVEPWQKVQLDSTFFRSYLEFRHAAPNLLEEELLRLGDVVGSGVFPSAVASALEALLTEARATQEDVLLSFETSDPTLLSLPFEAARLPGGCVPALEAGVRVLRRHLGAKGGISKPLPRPLRILVAVGAPDEDQTQNAVLDMELELQSILDAVDEARAYGEAEVNILEVGHPDQILAALLSSTYHVLYLSGHGMAGEMELETEDGAPHRVTAKDLADTLRSARKPLPLVVLATCQGGASSSDTVSFAQGLLEHGIPRVLAMQSSVSDAYATQLAGAFYGYLTKPDVQQPSHALALARQSLERKRRAAVERGAFEVPEYATPSLFCAGPETPLVDWKAAKAKPSQREPRPISGPVPRLKVGELVGRRKELRTLLRVLCDDARAVAEYGRKSGAVLLGLGGVGKSALAGRALDRLADRGWRIVVIEGRWGLGELATQVGTALVLEGDRSLKKIGAQLRKDNLQDQVRLQLLGQLVRDHEVLLVLDNFEDNLSLGGGSFLESSMELVLAALLPACQKGKLLFTSRYPIPRTESWLVALHVGPLSPAQTRKLLYRLTELKDQPLAVLKRILRLIGGHPRVLEYLDAILHKGTGRLSTVEQKLRENVDRLGLNVEDLGGDLEESVQDAIRIGAQDVFLDEILETVLIEPELRHVLDQASIFPTAINLLGLAYALNGAREPTTEEIAKLRKLAKRLIDSSLLTALEHDTVWVHRWTAQALRDRMGDRFQEYSRLAGESLLWKIGKEEHVDPNEAVRLLLQGSAYDRAVQTSWLLVDSMTQYGQSVAVLSLTEEILASLPPEHDAYPGFLRETADAGLTLGLSRPSEERYRLALEIGEQRVRDEPNRADHQRDLSVSYNKLGDLLRALGQGEQAKTFYESALSLIERLARDEPNRADYQRDLSVSYERMGDLLSALGQREQAKTFYESALSLSERLARDEPNRADYQRDLSVSYNKLGDLLSDFGQGEQAKTFYESALSLRERLARDEPNRADYQRDLSVSHNKLGDLLRALGQGEQAKAFYESALSIIERLARDEPNRADYQRDLSVSYIKLGDLLRALGQGEQAKTFYESALSLIERLARDEPNRADYQSDFALSLERMGDLHNELDQVKQAKTFFEDALHIRNQLAAVEPGRADRQVELVVPLVRLAALAPEGDGQALLLRALTILEGLKERGVLLPMYEPWIGIIREQLGNQTTLPAANT